MLDDGAGRGALGIELGDAFIGGVGVIDVVVGELLALRLARRRDAGAGLAGAIEGGRLVRVLAVAQGFREPAADGAIGRRWIAQRGCEPIRDGGVIGGSAAIGLGGEPLAQRQCGRAVVLLKLRQQRRIIIGVDDHGYVGVVLGR